MKKQTWKRDLNRAIRQFINQAIPEDAIPSDHLYETPVRVVKAFSEYISGYDTDPASFLSKRFTGNVDQMVRIRRIEVKSMCAHHLVPIIGVAHFAYLPDKYVVGLSKIPRMINCLSRRLQFQEQLTDQIVDIFQDKVKPLGCAVHIRAIHLCLYYRGIEEPHADTETTALRGCFKDPSTKAEFLGGITRESIF